MNFLLPLISILLLILLLCLDQISATPPRKSPSASGYTKTVGFYCPVEDGDADNAFPGSFAVCVKACSANVTCFGFNFEMAIKSGHTSTCQLVRTPCNKKDGQLKPAGADNAYYSKGETSCQRNNAGNEFIFAFMANRPQQPRKMNLEIFTAHNGAENVIVTMETADAVVADNDNASSFVLSSSSSTIRSEQMVERNIPQVFQLPPMWKMTDAVKGKGPKSGAAIVEKKAIRVFSKDGSKFYAVGSNKEHFTGDAFLGIPVSSLGRRYFAACYSPPFYACEFAVASSDNDSVTIVNITLPDNETVRLGPDAVKPKVRSCNVQLADGSVFTNGDTFSVSLGPLEVLQVQDPCDLTGALIEATKPVAFFSGNVRTNVGEGTDSRDHLVEQLLPTNTWGYDCSGAPTPGRSIGDYWSVTASSPATVVEILSGTSLKDNVELEKPGSSFRFKAKSYTNLFFKANKPIQVISYVHSQMLPEEQADPSMTVCTPSAQFDYSYTFVQPTEVGTTYRSFLTVIIENGQQSQLRLDGGQLFSNSWQSVPSTNLISSYFELPPIGVHTIDHQKGNVRFAAYIYGAGDRASFAFPLGICANEITCAKSSSVMQIGDGIDNDCDSMIDEEVCDGRDDDDDGRVDEDCYVIFSNNEAPPPPPVPKKVPLVEPSPRSAATVPISVSSPPVVVSTSSASLPLTSPPMTSSISSNNNNNNNNNNEMNEHCLDVRSAIGCYNAKIVLECGNSAMKIKVLSAHFGRTGYRDEFTCNNGNPVGVDGREISCGLRDVYWPIAQACDSQTACSYHVHLYELGDIAPFNQRCQLCLQYAVVQYVCVESLALERMTLSGRVGAESADRYWASSWAYGSAPLPSGEQCESDRSYNSACYRAPDEAVVDSAAIKSKTWSSDTTGPASARFSTSSTQAWCPAFCDRQDGWLIVDLGGHYEVTGYMIQGRRAEEQWVSSIRLAYSSDGTKWTELRYNNGSWMHFPGNYDARSIVVCDLTQQNIIARFMRTFVGTYSGQPCLHIDFFRKNQQMGCPPKTIQNSNVMEEPGRRGISLQVQCKRGWKTADGEISYTIKCGSSSGEWEGDARPCSELVNCSDIPLVDGALHNGQHTRPGARVDYTCTGGRTLIGNATIICGKHGDWSPKPPRCIQF